MAGLRSLSPDEVKSLEANGSRAEDWSRVKVADGFSPARVRRADFRGDVELGAFKGTMPAPGGAVETGVYDSTVSNCSIGDDSLVSRVGLLANYRVEAGASVWNCGVIAVEGETSFGNGVQIDVFNEGGGREVRLFERMSAQVAYMAAGYRHRPALVAALDKMARDFARSRLSKTGVIGRMSRVWNCGSVRNVAVGEFARVDGAAELENGTVLSKEEAPSTIGTGVVAKDFITATGSTVDGRAIIGKTFVGQGTKLGRQVSVENTALFANCEGYHGEILSMLAGPYTVTHHKSTLLIAGLFSFYNAGSGTNQSNHMYKMGPVHQGVLERGVKTGSFSYLLWPSRVGAFTAVIGKHYANFDTRNLPFSYITDDDGKSVISPATNLFTVGTKRDGAKWPARDRRKDSDKLDLINFEVLSPYTVGRILKGVKEIDELYKNAPRELDYVSYRGIQIKRLLCRTAKKHYDLALKIYFGRALAERIEAATDVKAALAPGKGAGAGEWVDVLGLMAPKTEIDALTDAVEQGKLATLDALEKELKRIHASYKEAEWNWVASAWAEWAGKPLGEMSADNLAQVVADWKVAIGKLNNMVLADAEKEFGEGFVRTGFGIDGDEAVRDADFSAVRGSFDDDKFVKALRAETAETAGRAEKILAKLK